MTVVTLQGIEPALGGSIPAAGSISVQYWAGRAPFVNVDGDWKQFGLLYECPPGTAELEFRFSFDSFNGTGWVDDCYLMLH